MVPQPARQIARSAREGKRSTSVATLAIKTQLGTRGWILGDHEPREDYLAYHRHVPGTTRTQGDIWIGPSAMTPRGEKTYSKQEGKGKKTRKKKGQPPCRIEMEQLPLASGTMQDKLPKRPLTFANQAARYAAHRGGREEAVCRRQERG